MVAEARTGKGPWTYEELSRRTPEDHVRREIIDGWLYIDGQPVDDPMADVVSDSATLAHQRVVLELAVRLRAHEDQHVGQTGLSPLDVTLGDHTVQPDVFWIPTDERVERPVLVTPSFVIEVSSPSTRRHDLVRKRRVYERAGVAEYWFVDLDANRIERYALRGEGSYDAPDLVPAGAVIVSSALEGFEVAVDDLLPY